MRSQRPTQCGDLWFNDALDLHPLDTLGTYDPEGFQLSVRFFRLFVEVGSDCTRLCSASEEASTTLLILLRLPFDLDHEPPPLLPNQVRLHHLWYVQKVSFCALRIRLEDLGWTFTRWTMFP